MNSTMKDLIEDGSASEIRYLDHLLLIRNIPGRTSTKVILANPQALKNLEHALIQLEIVMFIDARSCALFPEP